MKKKIWQFIPQMTNIVVLIQEVTLKKFTSIRIQAIMGGVWIKVLIYMDLDTLEEVVVLQEKQMHMIKIMQKVELVEVYNGYQIICYDQVIVQQMMKMVGIVIIYKEQQVIAHKYQIIQTIKFLKWNNLFYGTLQIM